MKLSSSLLRSLSVALVMAGPAFAAGCGSSADPTASDAPLTRYELQPNALLAPRAVSDAASVDGSRVVLPATKELRAWAESLAPGKVIAGNRDTTTTNRERSRNRFGFLGRVVSVDLGDPIVIVIAHAELQDLFAEADLDFGSSRSIFPDAPAPPPEATRLTTGSLRVLDDAKSGDLSGDKKQKPIDTAKNKPAMSGAMNNKKPSGVHASANLRDGVYELNPEISGRAKLTKQVEVDPCKGRWNPISVFKESCPVRQDVPWPEEIWVQLDARPRVTFTLDLTVAGEGVAESEWEGPKIEFEFPAGPVPLFLSFQPKATCEFAAGAAATLSITPLVEGLISLKGDLWSGGTMRQELRGSIETEGEGQAHISTHCSLKGVVELSAFRAIGVGGEFGPYIEGGAAICGGNGAKPAAAVSIGIEGRTYAFAQAFTDMLRLPELDITDGSHAFKELSFGDTNACPVCKWPSIPVPPSEEDGPAGLTQCKQGQLTR